MKKSLGQSIRMTNWKGIPHPLPSFQFPKEQSLLPEGALGFLFYQEQHGTNIFILAYPQQSIAGTIGISDLKETIQFIAAHVKAIRRIMKWFSIWCPEASKNYTRERLGRNSFLFGDKEGRSQASVATWKRHSSLTLTYPCIPRWPEGSVRAAAQAPGVTDAGSVGFSINQAYVF